MCACVGGASIYVFVLMCMLEVKNVELNLVHDAEGCHHGHPVQDDSKNCCQNKNDHQKNHRDGEDHSGNFSGPEWQLEKIF